MDVLERDARAALSALGRTPYAIAKSLKRLKIKGDRHMNHKCPLGVYLNKKFHTSKGLDLIKSDRPTSAAIQMFIREFDKGNIPNYGGQHESSRA